MLGRLVSITPIQVQPADDEHGNQEINDMSDRGNGVYISSGAIALVALVIWLL